MKILKTEKINLTYNKVFYLPSNIYDHIQLPDFQVGVIPINWWMINLWILINTQNISSGTLWFEIIQEDYKFLFPIRIVLTQKPSVTKEWPVTSEDLSANTESATSFAVHVLLSFDFI